MKIALALLGAASVLALGCSSDSGKDEVSESLDRLAAKLDESRVPKEVFERLAKLEQRLATLEKRPAAAPARAAPPAQASAYRIPVGGSPVLGPKDAKVSLAIFSDFQCPYCARVDPMLQQLVKDEELEGKVNVVFKHFPLDFHKQARPASKAALAAAEQGEEHFWTMSEKFYANQRALTPENFEKWAGEIGLDVAKFKSDLAANDAEYEKLVQEDLDLGRKVAVRGTPTLYVGGWTLRDRSVNGVKALIKEKKLL